MLKTTLQTPLHRLSPIWSIAAIAAILTNASISSSTSALETPPRSPCPESSHAGTLNFDLPSADSRFPSPPPSPPLFHGDAESLVARTVGHAEGTRTAEGDRTPAYDGHTDPGNGVWNQGSFSFQHCGDPAYPCATPEDADRHQLQRLSAQAAQLRQRAISAQISLTLEAELNGIDLANQAPVAALGTPGYVEWLKVAQENGLTGKEAIVWARVSSFWDSAIANWNAPGLGNTAARIEQDQRRRVDAIARALAAYQAQQWSREEAIAAQIIAQHQPLSASRSASDLNQTVP